MLPWFGADFVKSLIDVTLIVRQCFSVYYISYHVLSEKAVSPVFLAEMGNKIVFRSHGMAIQKTDFVPMF